MTNSESYEALVRFTAGQANDQQGPPAPASAQVPPAPVRGRRARALVQLNTRVSPLLDDLMALVGERQGMSKRDVIEYALKTAYSREYASLAEHMKVLDAE